jgi:hypothetical protein
LMIDKRKKERYILRLFLRSKLAQETRTMQA